MRKKVEKMFHALHKVDLRACYAKQKINLAYPYFNGGPLKMMKNAFYLMSKALLALEIFIFLS